MLREQISSVGWSALRRRFVTSLALSLGVMLLPNFAAAQSTSKNRAQRAKPAETATQADGLVKEALYHEIYGAKSQRDRLLTEARKLAPNFAPALWQSGHVRHNDRWLKADEVSELAAGNRNLARYVVKRNESPDTAAGHLALARWCEGRDLAGQARAHYTNVLDFQPDHAEARSKLGFRRLNGIWVTEAELRAVNDEAKQLTKAIETWSPIANRIREGLLSPSEKNRKAAEQELAKLEDVAAIPVLERALSAADEVCAVKLVNRLADWRDPQATRSLARQAVYSPWEAVRQLAAHKLQGRPYEEYVPNLLDMLRSAVQVSSEVFRAGDQLVLREFFLREGPNAWELLTLDTAYTRNAVRGGDANDTLSRAIVDMRRTATMRQSVATVQNGEQSQLNERIMGGLAIATGQTTNVRPDDWWAWWNSENEMSVSGTKSTESRYDRDRRYVTDQRINPPTQPRPLSGSPSSERSPRWSRSEGVQNPAWRPSLAPLQQTGFIPTGGPLIAGAPASECLAAGTPVWTLTGTQPIEQLRVGDLVLSQDTETGELAYKPVLRRTVRPAGPVFQIEIDGQSYRASGGHLFWVTGEGWTKSRHLQSGNVLHACDGTATVSQTTEAASEPTYNLVVADFNTYFIGPEKILSHDVTLRQPSRAVVPGLLRE